MKENSSCGKEGSRDEGTAIAALVFKSFNQPVFVLFHPSIHITAQLHNTPAAFLAPSQRIVTETSDLCNLSGRLRPF